MEKDMNNTEKLDLLISVVIDVKNGMSELKKEIEERFEKIDEHFEKIEERLTNIEMKLENEVNKNINILAENHIDLIDKLNESINAENKNRLYEIKVEFLVDKVGKLEHDVDDLKKRVC